LRILYLILSGVIMVIGVLGFVASYVLQSASLLFCLLGSLVVISVFILILYLPRARPKAAQLIFSLYLLLLIPTVLSLLVFRTPGEFSARTFLVEIIPISIFVYAFLLFAFRRKKSSVINE